jgi:hypothetical protein
VALAAWGAGAATSGERPLDLLGAMAAAAGVLLAGLALCAAVVRGVLGGAVSW